MVPLFVIFLATGATAFIQQQENSIAHYSFEISSYVNLNLQKEAYGEVYLHPTSNDTFQGILRRFRASETALDGTKSQEEINKEMLEKINEANKTPFFVKVNELGAVLANFTREDSFKSVSENLMNDKKMILAISRVKKNSNIQWEYGRVFDRARKCVQQYRIQDQQPNFFRITTQVNSSSCSSLPEGLSFYENVVRVFSENGNLTSLSFYSEIRRVNGGERSLNLTVVFQGFIPYDKRVFEPRAKPLESRLLPIKSIVLQRDGYDTTYKGSFEIKLGHSIPEYVVRFELIVRESGSEDYLFGQMTKIDILDFARPRRLYKMIKHLESPFVFGIRSDKGNEGQFVFKFLDQDTPDMSIHNFTSPWYLQGIYLDPHVFKLIKEGKSTDKKNVRILGKNRSLKCFKNYTAHTNNQFSYQLNVSFNTSECSNTEGVFGESSRLAMVNTYYVEGGKLLMMKLQLWGITMTPDFKDVTDIAKVRVFLHRIHSYPPHVTNQFDNIQVYDEPLDSTFFDKQIDY